MHAGNPLVLVHQRVIEWLTSNSQTDNNDLFWQCSLSRIHPSKLVPLDPRHQTPDISSRKIMKIVQLVVAASIALTTAPSFAQSTPLPANDEVRAQLAQEKSMYGYSDADDLTPTATSGSKPTVAPPHQITGLELGRYSLSVVRPSF